jgi:hypothetical protein
MKNGIERFRRTFSSEARRSTVSASACTAPQSSRTLRMWRLGESISVVKTNSGAAVTTCTSWPAPTRCRTTCEAKIRSTRRAGADTEQGRWRGGGAADLEGAGGVAEAVAGDVVGEDKSARLLAGAAASPIHHPSPILPAPISGSSLLLSVSLPGLFGDDWVG